MDNYGKKIYSLNFSCSPKEYRRYVKKFASIYGRFLPRDRNSRILDLGCGAGHFLYFLRSLGYNNLSGIDISRDQIEQAKKIVECSLENIGINDFLSSTDKEYDLIICNHIIEHLTLPETEQLFRKMLIRLSSTGKIIITTPNANSLWANYALFSDITHKRLFTAESLLQINYNLPVKLSFYEEGAAAYDFLSAVRWVLYKIRQVYLRMLFIIDVGPWRNKSKPMIFSSNLICIIERNQR